VKWDVIHQEGHVEKRKKDKSTWTIEEVGNVEADIVAGNARGQFWESTPPSELG
jgi:hypothetical protein